MEQEENKKIEEKDIIEKVICDVESLMYQVQEQGINMDNVDFLGKIVDIHKDLKNEDYWKIKEEYYMYRDYGNYDDNSYGRRGVKGTGRFSRYRDGDSYGRRGVPGTGRGRYRGEEMLDDMMNEYRMYSEGRDTYGADSSTMESFKYMLKAFKDYYKHLKQEASSQEEVKMLEDTAQEIAEM